MADTIEYCEWETFNATCRDHQVVIVDTAKYGRMALGRCVTKDYGHIGCGMDVKTHFDRLCSGRRHCVVPVNSLLDSGSCPKDLKAYLTVAFKCVHGKYFDVVRQT